MSKEKTVQLPITGGIRVTIPDDPTLMTHYVLSEQQDWFEDEIKFVRAFIKPGMNAIDIGANYGLYTLTIAAGIGNTGKLWAFEPTQRTADCLRASIEDNGFKNIKLIQAGLSNKTGKATFYTSPNAEMNSLTAVPEGGSSETIKLLTLDSCQQDYKIHDIEFLKIDAEGEEANILKKAKNTLSQMSPLIMFELKHSNEVNKPLLNRLLQMGHTFYRLVPATNTLTPCDPDTQNNSFILNLFACTPDKANQLEAHGYIVTHDGEIASDEQAAQEGFAQLAAHGSMAPLFKHADDDYLSMLNSCAASLSPTLPAPERTKHLLHALQQAETIVGTPDLPVEHLATCGRIAFDAGERGLGLNILHRMFDTLDSDGNHDFRAPCFPPTSSFDCVTPADDLNKWLYAATLDALIQKTSWSGYFAGQQYTQLYNKLSELGYLTPERERWMNVAKSRV